MMNEIDIPFSSDTEQGLLFCCNKSAVSSSHEHRCQATVILRIFLHIFHYYPVMQISLEG